MTLPSTPNDRLGNVSFSDLMRVLLSQFKRLLADEGVKLTADETLEVANAIASRSSHPKLPEIRRVMQQLVLESVDLLQTRWHVTFNESLNADMSEFGEWKTTAEFLEIANEKSNAELRISAGASLLVAMGDLAYAPYLLDVTRHDAGVMDVDAVFAKRALLHVSQLEDSSEWLEQTRQWLAKQ